MRFIAIVALTCVLLGTTAAIKCWKRLSMAAVATFMLYGALMALPFIGFEWILGHIGLILFILVVSLEFLILFFEEHIRPIHHLIHRNLAMLGLWSYFFMGIGFSYTDILYTLLHTHSLAEVVARTPLQMILAPLSNLVLFMVVGIISMEHHVWHLLRTYSEIVWVGVSHFLFILLSHYQLAHLFVPVLAINLLIIDWDFSIFSAHLKILKDELNL
ncbi:hypothetical protein HZA43_02240 [Candidatus Peregrinibacteria bacterium]|nr:hypothetical protein [Candidatus Peregrinibacteria bacterium]